MVALRFSLVTQTALHPPAAVKLTVHGLPLPQSMGDFLIRRNKGSTLVNMDVAHWNSASWRFLTGDTYTTEGFRKYTRVL